MNMPQIPGFQKSDKGKILRHIYLYLVTTISIVLIIVSAIGFINLFFKHYVFDVKDWSEFEDPWECTDETLLYSYGPNGEKVDKLPGLTLEQKATTKTDCIAKATEKRHLQAVNTLKQDIAWYLSMLLVSLPLYLYHWGIIKKESKK